MDPESERDNRAITNFIGWCLVAAAFYPLLTVSTLVHALGANSSAGGNLLIMTVPLGLMIFIAGVGLIRGKQFGYWCAYLATFFGGVGGWKVSFVPFAQTFINFGAATGHALIALNLILVGFLAWEHWHLIEEREWEKRKVHRIGLVLVLLAGFASVSFGWAIESVHRGQVRTAANLPVLGEHFEKLVSVNPGTFSVKYEMLHNELTHTVEAVISGESPEAGLRAFAEEHQLKPIENYRKILPKARRWKLDEKGFPIDFAPPDLVFVGRPKNGDKAIVQIAWRKRDLKWTAEIMGSVTPGQLHEAAKLISPP